jgi:GT2 family glycosyltransferase
MTLANASVLLRRLSPLRRRLDDYQMLDEDFSAPMPIPQPSATCLLLRRSDLPEDHIFDERYPIFFNDVALARLLAEQGKELWMTPEAVVFHERSASTRQLGGALKRQYLGSLVRYLASTEPSYRVLLFRALMLAQGAALALGRSPRALPLGDLWAAMRGDPGRIPQTPRPAHMRDELEELLTAHSVSTSGSGR